MASWNFREVEQREEIAELKSRLAVKGMWYQLFNTCDYYRFELESKFAALEDQLLTKNAELCSIRESLEETTTKVSIPELHNLSTYDDHFPDSFGLKRRETCSSNQSFLNGGTIYKTNSLHVLISKSLFSRQKKI